MYCLFTRLIISKTQLVHFILQPYTITTSYSPFVYIHFLYTTFIFFFLMFFIFLFFTPACRFNTIACNCLSVPSNSTTISCKCPSSTSNSTTIACNTLTISCKCPSTPLQPYHHRLQHSHHLL